MFCPNCGLQTDKAAFCPRCGTKLTLAQSAPVAPPAPAPQPVYVAPPQPPMPMYVTPPAPPRPQRNPAPVKSVFAMVLGILSLVASVYSCCYWAGSVVSLIAAIVALCLGKSAKKQSAAVGLPNKKAKVGTTLATIALILSALTLVLIIVFYLLYFFGALSSAYSDLNEFNQFYNSL